MMDLIYYKSRQQRAKHFIEKVVDTDLISCYTIIRR